MHIRQSRKPHVVPLADVEEAGKLVTRIPSENHIRLQQSFRSPFPVNLVVFPQVMSFRDELVHERRGNPRSLRSICWLAFLEDHFNLGRSYSEPVNQRVCWVTVRDMAGKRALRVSNNQNRP